MSLDTFEPEPADYVALLQPYIDGELDEGECARVEQQIEGNPDFEALVREQREVQALLRGLAPALAPAGLRERVFADLDAIDAELRDAEQRGWLAPIVGRIKAFGKGALLMVPAVAAAGVLFVVASNAGWTGSLGEDHVDGSMASSLDVGPKLELGHAEQAPAPGPDEGRELPSARELGFAVQVAPARALPQGVAQVRDSVARPGSSAMVRYRDAEGVVMVDHQRRAGVAPLRGTSVEVEGHGYHLGRDALGRAFVEFHLAGVHHSLMLEGEQGSGSSTISAAEPDFSALLSVAAALRAVD